MLINKPLILSTGTGVAPAYTIDQSIRFDSTANAHMDRTPSSAGNQKTWTFSCWVKRGKLGSRQFLFTAFDGNNTNVGMGIFRFQSDDTLNWAGYTTNIRRTTQVFRDTSAWYHIVLSVDTTQDVGSERQRIYINGERVTDFADSSDMAYDTAYSINGNHAHAIGIGLGNQSSYDFDGYMAEIVLLDGTATDCNSFGEFNSSGIWIPKDVSGLTFGTNGFHIDGRDASGTPVKLGDDEAGSNNYTTSGMDASDQKKDSPTNNHATWNPLTTSAQAYTNGNLNAASSSSAWKGGLATVQVPLNSGTWYYEVYIDSAGSSSGQFSVGWSESNRSLSDNNSSGDTEGWVTYALNGNYYSNGGNGSYGATYTTGNVIGCKIDTNSSTNNVEFYKDGASQGTLSQAFNTGGTGFISPYILLYATRNGTARFAQAEWTQTPSGITEANAINTSNLGS